MRFDIDGVDFAPYIARGGLKFQKFKVSSKDSGRDTQDAKMHLTVLAQKHKITATFRPLKAEEAAVELLPELPPQAARMPAAPTTPEAFRKLRRLIA